MTETSAFLDPGMKGFIVNTANREHWRVAQIYPGSDGLQDLIQDGYICFYKCVRAYPQISSVKIPTKDQRRHFQALVKTAFTNHIHTLAAKRKGVTEVVVSQIPQHAEVDGQVVWDKLLPSQPETATFTALIANAPAEIKQLVELLVGDGMGILGFKRTKKRRRALRETNNEFYCRILGLDATKVDMVGRLKEYFS